MSNNTILKGLERMGYKGRMKGHGFRGLASTILQEQGYNHEHIELQLAHTPRNAVSAAYNHALYLEPRIRMMQDWADFLERTQRSGKLPPDRGSAGNNCTSINSPSPRADSHRRSPVEPDRGTAVMEQVHRSSARLPSSPNPISEVSN